MWMDSEWASIEIERPDEGGIALTLDETFGIANFSVVSPSGKGAVLIGDEPTRSFLGAEFRQHGVYVLPRAHGRSRQPDGSSRIVLALEDGEFPRLEGIHD